ncbi:MAG: NAD(P)-binding protein, partial [Actinobacteria bacterium]|nr:NAD(P)-binding protein [Actinomycetota bacterium]
MAQPAHSWHRRSSARRPSPSSTAPGRTSASTATTARRTRSRPASAGNSLPRRTRSRTGRSTVSPTRRLPAPDTSGKSRPRRRRSLGATGKERGSLCENPRVVDRGMGRPGTRGFRMSNSGSQRELDVVVVGAGFSGMYLLYKLRPLGFSVKVLEAGTDVGGTWFWNRYPGARVDIQSVEYSMTFDPQLEKDWKWTEKYSPQPELLKYAQHISERYDLRKDIEFTTKVESAKWDDKTERWTIHTSTGDTITAKYYVMASGTLSVPKDVDIEGKNRFKGATYLTSRWPHEGVDFTGKRVAVIGTGSSAIQSIPIIASQAKSLTVFQRTPSFSIPAYNGPVPETVLDEYWSDRDGFRQAQRESAGGVKHTPTTVSALSVSDEERNRIYEEAWA